MIIKFIIGWRKGLKKYGSKIKQFILKVLWWLDNNINHGIVDGVLDYIVEDGLSLDKLEKQSPELYFFVHKSFEFCQWVGELSIKWDTEEK